MATVNEIREFVELLAPGYMKEDWDNVGLLCGCGGGEVRKILVALDPFMHVCEEAAEIGADLIVTHHPLIFSAMKSVTDGDSVGRCVLYLIEHGIAAINAHTNLDQTPGGVNDTLAEVLELEDVSVLNPCGEDAEGEPWGLLRAGIIEETPLEDFAAFVKERMNCPGLRFVDAGRPVCRVAVGGGACGGGIYEVAEAGCDTFVTSDVKYNQFWDALELGLNLIDAGHFETENPVCRVLAEALREEFPEVEVVISEKHGDPIQFL